MNHYCVVKLIDRYCCNVRLRMIDSFWNKYCIGSFCRRIDIEDDMYHYDIKYFFEKFLKYFNKIDNENHLLKFVNWNICEKDNNFDKYFVFGNFSLEFWNQLNMYRISYKMFKKFYKCEVIVDMEDLRSVDFKICKFCYFFEMGVINELIYDFDVNERIFSKKVYYMIWMFDVVGIMYYPAYVEKRFVDSCDDEDICYMDDILKRLMMWDLNRNIICLFRRGIVNIGIYVWFILQICVKKSRKWLIRLLEKCWDGVDYDNGCQDIGELKLLLEEEKEDFERTMLEKERNIEGLECIFN